MPGEQLRGGKLQAICAAIKNCSHIVVQLLWVSCYINNYICSMVGFFQQYEPFMQARCEMFTLAFSPEFQLKSRECLREKHQTDTKRSNKTNAALWPQRDLSLNKTNWSPLTDSFLLSQPSKTQWPGAVFALDTVGHTLVIHSSLSSVDIWSHLSNVLHATWNNSPNQSCWSKIFHGFGQHQPISNRCPDVPQNHRKLFLHPAKQGQVSQVLFIVK